MGLFADFVAITYDSFTNILVVHFLVRLQEAARPTTSSNLFESGVLDGTGTLQFMRGNDDSWAREPGSGLSLTAEVSAAER